MDLEQVAVSPGVLLIEFALCFLGGAEVRRQEEFFMQLH